MQVRNTRWTPGVAVLLAASAGFVDVVGYLTLHRVFTAHMTGDASKLGVALGHGHLAAALPFLVVPAAWTAGVAAGTLLADRASRAVPLAVQAALVLAYMGYGAAVVRHGFVHGTAPSRFYALLVIAASLLGLQTSAITEIGGTTVRTTYISGVLTNLTQAAVRRLTGGDDGGHRLRLLAGIWLAFVGGATLGSATLGPLGIWCLALPAGALALAAALER